MFNSSSSNQSIPEDVQKLLDEADDSGPYGAKFTLGSVQLVDVKSGQVVREVRWPEAGEFARNILRNSLQNVQIEDAK